MPDTVEKDETGITEMTELEALRVDAVGKPANGTGWLLLKSTDVDDVMDDLDDLESDLDDLIGQDSADGAQLEDDDDAQKADAVDDGSSGKVDCPTCDGSGKIRGDSVKCPDCAGTGKVTADKADDLKKSAAVKAARSTKSKNDLPDSSFAYIEPGGTKDDDGKTTPRNKRHFPIKDAAGNDDPAHVRNALARASQSPHGDKALPKIKAAANRLGIGDDAQKSLIDAGRLVKDAAPLVVLTDGTPDGIAGDGANVPGSQPWEEQDAQSLIECGQAITVLMDQLGTSLARERLEQAVGCEGSWDVWSLDDCIYALNNVLSVVARLAFLEEAEARRAGGVEKEGRRLSAATVKQLKTAISSLRDLLGADAGDGDDDSGSPDVKKETDVMAIEMTRADLDEMVTKAAQKAAAEAVAPIGDALVERISKIVKKATKQKAEQEPGSTAEKSDEKSETGDATDEAAKETKPEGGETKAEGDVSKETKADETNLAAVLKEQLVDPVLKAVGDLDSRMKAVEERPRTGGPLLDGGGTVAALLAATGSGDGKGTDQWSDVGKALAAIEDPAKRASVAEELSRNRLTGFLKHGGEIPR